LEVSKNALAEVEATNPDNEGAALIVTEILLSDVLQSHPSTALGTKQFSSFHAASENHQCYFEKYENSSTYCSLVIQPKLTNLQHLDHIAKLLK
jgi:peptide methionine sulfoxide reductase MsrA